MNKKPNWAAILAVSAAGICLISCLGLVLVLRFAPNLYQFSLNQSSLSVGSAAPDFELPLLGAVVT